MCSFILILFSILHSCILYIFPEPVISKLYAFAQLNLMCPAKSVKLIYVGKLSRRTIRHILVPYDLALVSDNFLNGFCKLLNGYFLTGSDVHMLFSAVILK